MVLLDKYRLLPGAETCEHFGRGLRSQQTGLEKTSQSCLDVQGSNCSIWNDSYGNSNKTEALESWAYVRCRARSQEKQHLRCLQAGVLQYLFSEVCCKGAGGLSCPSNGRGSIVKLRGRACKSKLLPQRGSQGHGMNIVWLLCANHTVTEPWLSESPPSLMRGREVKSSQRAQREQLSICWMPARQRQGSRGSV